MAFGKSDLARQYRDKYGMEMPTKKLARIMYKENNLNFRDEEEARSYLRRIEGKSKGNRAKITHPLEEHRPRNPYNLPESDEIPYEPFVLNASRILVLSDIHIPYHNIDSLTAAIDWGIERNPDAILLNGDIIDCYQISRFGKDPMKRDFASELLAFRQLFESLQTAFPKAKIYFKLGNHELRYDHFLFMKAHELVGVEEFKLENIIKARANGIEVIGDKTIVKAGQLNIIHGHEFGHGFFSPVNVARGLFLRAKVSCMQGDRHQTSEHTETNMNGQITTTWSAGCLCELHPEYLPINRWNHGFSFVEVEKSGEFDVQNLRIHKGKVL